MCYDTVGWVMWPVKPSSKWPTVCRVGRLNSTIPYHSRTSYLSLIRGACPGKLIQVISSRWDRTGYLVQVSSFMRACPGELIQVISSIELVHASSSRWSRPGDLVQLSSFMRARPGELIQVILSRWARTRFIRDIKHMVLPLPVWFPFTSLFHTNVFLV